MRYKSQNRIEAHVSGCTHKDTSNHKFIILSKVKSNTKTNSFKGLSYIANHFENANKEKKYLTSFILHKCNPINSK